MLPETIPAWLIIVSFPVLVAFVVWSWVVLIKLFLAVARREPGQVRKMSIALAGTFVVFVAGAIGVTAFALQAKNAQDDRMMRDIMSKGPAEDSNFIK